MKKHKILVVDDEVSLARTVALHLEDAGRYEVEIANSGAAGLAKARTFRPDLVLLDLMMPDMDGSEVAERLGKDPRLCHVPIVFLTAVVAKAEVRAGGEFIGGRCFLAKPTSAAELLACIDRQLLKSGGPRPVAR